VTHRAVARGAVRVNYRHVPDGGDEHHRVDCDVRSECDVRRDVDEVVHQPTRHVTKRPPVGGKDIGGERRDDDDETQVCDGEIQQREMMLDADTLHVRFSSRRLMTVRMRSLARMT